MLAGFSDAEAVKIFGRPIGIDPTTLDIVPAWPAAVAEKRFLKRFAALAQAMGG